ncbi:fimbrial protein [Citrobacter braakii]|uniref:fimbrial protein n=1 Tax=Citrobacter braakii TaxID=57706 RepID=UPI0039769F6A
MLQKKKNYIFTLVFGLTSAFTAPVEAASCVNSGGYYTFSGALNYQRDDATMNVFSHKFGSISSEVWGLGCTGDPDADRDVYLRLQVNSAPVAGYTDVYPTNIDGIGVRYNFALNSGSLSFCPVQFDDHISNSTRTYTIDLNCDAGARINASLSGTQSAETANDSILALSGAGMSGVASGIGIQLLYGNTPLKLDNNIVLKTSAGGQEFPPGAFTARYFQTKNNVTAGSANATATLNITYQ